MSKRGDRVRRNSYPHRKGQVTVFVILGIVMFVVMIFAIVASSSIAKIKVQVAANKAVDAYLASEAIDYYVYTCMDSAVTSSIEEISLQGGVFYDYQGGTLAVTPQDAGVLYIPFNTSYVDSNPELVRNVLVSYSILDMGYCDIVETDSPDYPYPRTYISELRAIYNSKSGPNDNSLCLYNYKEGYALSGFAGFNNMSRLCKLGGNNTKPVSVIDVSPCYKSLLKDPQRTIEFQLEKQISQKMEECTDFNVFKDDNITVIGHPTTTITYTTDSLFAETTFNLSVKIKNKEPVVVKHSFNYQSDLRIVKMHNYVMSLLKADSQDFMFSIGGNYQYYDASSELNPEMFFDPEYMNVYVVNFTSCNPSRTPGCENYKYDHIIIVQDRKSKIGNNSLTYMTAVKNRPPALDYIHYTIPQSEFDIVVSDNQEIVISPIAYDPDDRNITYTYEGWKETHEDDCKLVTAAASPNAPEDSLASLFDCTKINDAENFKRRNWTGSVMYQKSKKNANYTTNVSDFGPHIVKVIAADESGKIDYQDVWILVFDLPKAKISPIKVYPDVDENTTSIEDKLPLDASESTSSLIGGGELTSYLWSILYVVPEEPEEVFANKTANPKIIIPNETYLMEDDLLIQEIVGLNLSHIGDHNVTLRVESPIPKTGTVAYSLPAVTELTVTNCLPHKNTAVPPFPYSWGDPFLADHTCCVNYDFAGTDTVCYKTARYAEKGDLLSSDIEGGLSNNSRFSSYTPSDEFEREVVAGGDANDIYILSFERFCAEDRGNICSGDMKATIKLHLACSKGAVYEGVQESCIGAPASPTNIAPSSCTRFGTGGAKQTFETQVLGTGTGICNTEWKCSSRSSVGYNNGFGRFLCQATCNNGDCRAATNCQVCRTGTCGATCDSEDFFRRINSVCQHSCSLDTCGYRTDYLPCGGTLSSCHYADYCWSNVYCDANGGHSTREEKGCVRGLDASTGKCYFSSNNNAQSWCTAGRCNLDSNMNSDVTCSSTQTKECDENIGWTCIGEASEETTTPQQPGVPTTAY